MELTPVRQRGKNRRKRQKVSQEEGRPSTYHKALDTVPQKRKRRRLPKLSPIESLPNEVLQEIHFLAGNINLPRSSPVLARKLSSDAIFMKFSLLHLESEADGHDLHDMAKHDGIMGCRFFTLEFYKRYLRNLASKGMPEWDEDTFWDIVDSKRRNQLLCAESLKLTPGVFSKIERGRMLSAGMLLTPKHQIPLKLIGAGEWTKERLQFLIAVTLLRDLVGWEIGLFRYSPVERHKEFMHASQQGLQAAIDQDNLSALAMLLAHRGSDISNAFIRATIRQGNLKMIHFTLSHASQDRPPDFLEEETWKCLDNAPMSGYERLKVRVWLLQAAEGKRWFLRPADIAEDLLQADMEQRQRDSPIEPSKPESRPEEID